MNTQCRVDGKKHGSGGKFSLQEGDCYEGDFSRGEITGKGTKTWVDGRTYTGDFVCGEQTGRGAWSSADGKEYYEGDFVDNRREGQGQHRVSNGDTYNGAFSRHKYHGAGSYLRENNFVVTSMFETGSAHGRGSISWHKAGSYEGSLVQGNMHGQGKYAAFNGSYRYSGEFSCNRPSYSVQKLNLFVDKSFMKSHAVEETSKKKAPAKGKKGADVSGDVLATVSAGHEIGRVVYLMSTEGSAAAATAGAGANAAGGQDEHAGQWTAPLSVPCPVEQLRAVRLRLREHHPPPPPAKGEAPRESDPASELGAVLPLWRRRVSAEGRSSAWERFPPSHCTRYISGQDILTGDHVVVEGGGEGFSVDAESGVTAAPVTHAADSCVSVAFVPSSLPEAHERLILITDFKFKIDPSASL